jgi:hypothetical protein
MTYDYHHTYRVIPLDGRPHIGKDINCGWAIRAGVGKATPGRRRGQQQRSNVAADRRGFHSDVFHVVERWTLTAPDHIVYLATIDDAKVYSRPWTLRVDFRRQKVKSSGRARSGRNKTPEIVSAAARNNGEKWRRRCAG